MQRFLLPLVVASFLSSVGVVKGAGNVAWIKGYPKGGPNPGEIAVKGKVVPDAGHKITSVVLSYGINGDVFQSKKLKFKKDGTIEEAVIDGLMPGTQYAVQLIVTQKPDSEEESSVLALVGFVTATPKKKN